MNNNTATAEVRDPQIAATIRAQIGGAALFMINAKYLTDHGNGLSFRIVCRGSKANYVKITLAADDTYRIEISKIGRAPNYKVTPRCDLEGCYADMLRPVIEEHTGLYLSMGTAGR